MNLSRKKRIAIIGATSAIAEHCTRLWAEEGPAEFVLVGRSLDRLARTAQDLRARSAAARIETVQTDFTDPAAIAATIDAICKPGPLDIALVAHGSLPDQQQCQNDLAACRQALDINAVSPALFAEAIATHMERVDHGTLAIIGSVAGDRGRQSNYTYGAAKGLVARYAQGLQHRLAGTRVKVVLIKPGPTDTPMTAHLKATGAALASPEEVARGIKQAIEASRATVYLPGKWAVIMMIIRHLPAFVFNKLRI